MYYLAKLECWIKYVAKLITQNYDLSPSLPLLSDRSCGLGPTTLNVEISLLTARNSSRRAVQSGICIPFIDTFRYCGNLSEISSDTRGTFVAISVVCHATEDSELRNLHYLLNLKAAKCSSVTKVKDVAAKVLRMQVFILRRCVSLV